MPFNLFPQGSWFRESGVLNIAVMKIFSGLICGLVTAVIYGLLGRMTKEDTALYQFAGKEWEDWVEKVPYRLFPLIYWSSILLPFVDRSFILLPIIDWSSILLPLIYCRIHVLQTLLNCGPGKPQKYIIHCYANRKDINIDQREARGWLTQEQVKCIQMLGKQKPYDSKDIILSCYIFPCYIGLSIFLKMNLCFFCKFRTHN